PKMMTVVTVIAGLLPIMWSHGTGSEVMQRIAAPMIGGMVSALILTLLVLPAAYYLWRSRSLTKIVAAPLAKRDASKQDHAI
ncbi:MAG: efflux RND transporter permease subunit, partial [Aeromonas sp.]